LDENRVIYCEKGVPKMANQNRDWLYRLGMSVITVVGIAGAIVVLIFLSPVWRWGWGAIVMLGILLAAGKFGTRWVV
jgi:hypothetical protein